MVLMDREAPWDHQALLAKMVQLDYLVGQVALESQAVKENLENQDRKVNKGYRGLPVKQAQKDNKDLQETKDRKDGKEREYEDILVYVDQY